MRLECILIPYKEQSYQTKPNSSKKFSFAPLFGHKMGLNYKDNCKSVLLVAQEVSFSSVVSKVSTGNLN